MAPITRDDWERNASAWTALARAGYDIYRDAFNTPAFLSMLPDVTGLRGLDLGCGEGSNTALVSKRGAVLTGVDHSLQFVRNAASAGSASFAAADAAALPFRAASFDFVTAFMSLMDMPALSAVLKEVRRVLKPAGFLQFSICHPCFTAPHRRNLRDAEGRPYAVEIGRYFEEGVRQERWLFSAAPEAVRAEYEPFVIRNLHQTLSSWLNLLIRSGFILEEVGEPKPTPAAIQTWPAVDDALVVAYFLHVRVRT